MLWLFDPPAPPAWPIKADHKQDGPAAGDVLALAGCYRINVEFSEEHEFDYYPDAAGEHVLRRFLKPKGARHPFQLPDLFPKGFDFQTHAEGIAYWDAPSKTEDESTVKWRMAFGWPWTRWPSLSGEAEGLEIAWTLWYGPAFWLAPLAATDPQSFDEWMASTGQPAPTSALEAAILQDAWAEEIGLNIALPLYRSDRTAGPENHFDGLRPVTLEKHAIGNGIIPGVFDFPEFPDELTLEPWWP